jgi:2-polyprenyl-3-methyl-5-hydroxy-6-metoxy-1,4-benzoquinol methylase
VTRDFFTGKADVYEQDGRRVSNVDNIARAMVTAVEFKPSMQLMDFGSGTGLLLERIAPRVKKITAVDVSESMNRKLQEKAPRLGCQLEIVQTDLEKTNLAQTFDGIISSMTMHHIKGIGAMFDRFYTMVRPGGFIAIADLDSEDGSFHTEDTGVCHFGFDRGVMAEVATRAGFSGVEVVTASVARKPHGDFPVFLLTARR